MRYTYANRIALGMALLAIVTSITISLVRTS
jgi:hypothetical protein